MSIVVYLDKTGVIICAAGVIAALLYISVVLIITSIRTNTICVLPGEACIVNEVFLALTVTGGNLDLSSCLRRTGIRELLIVLVRD